MCDQIRMQLPDDEKIYRYIEGQKVMFSVSLTRIILKIDNSDSLELCGSFCKSTGHMV